MLDINVKTIDGQNRSYSIPDNVIILNKVLNLKFYSKEIFFLIKYSVRQFKEKIASSLVNLILVYLIKVLFFFYKFGCLKNIPIERQRLIFQGRELKDNNALNEFGKLILNA